jgi:hypothetical protein
VNNNFLRMIPVMLFGNPHTKYFYQEKQIWPWPSVPAHEQRSALVNCWTGNQLPSNLTYIPGVPVSTALWSHPTSYTNSISKQVQYNKGYNIQLSGPIEQSSLMRQAILNWYKGAY